ncbi:MAG TPA: LuxR C-terminal-related transcriptional regulator, partial [Candidatus Limnocylindrales bacterium]|nr:LuxR C-terminal-related transcriptional regulator [Candidatus Limnocylindrales bacterium]
WADLGAVAARHGGEPALLAEALAYVALTRLLAGHEPDESQVADALALEDSSRPPYLGLSPRGVIGLVRALTARHEEARRLLGEARDALDQIGDDCDLAHALLWSAWNELRAGRLSDAAELAEQAATIAETTGSELLRTWACSVSALVAASRGDLASVDVHVRAALADGGASGIVVLWCAAATCLGNLALDRPGPAADAMLTLPASALRARLPDPVLGFFVPDAAEALARAGMRDAAEAILAPFAAAATSRGRRWALAAALRAEASFRVQEERRPEAIEALRSALALHEPAELPLEHARALLHLGQLLRRTGQRRAARETLTAAAALFTESGADGWATLAADEVRRVPGRRRRAVELTPAEWRVAELSGRGMTNREVAAALFVSPKTVEATLARIYGKLAIATRAELGAWMARHENASL